MRELREVIHEAFAGHARALGDGGVEVAPSTALDDIRRRRTRRSVAAVGGAVAASGAIAFAAIAIPGSVDGGTTIAAPGGTAPAPSGDAPAWCYLDDYPAPNPDAWGPAGFVGRVYANYVDEEFVYVSPDGDVQHMERSGDGAYDAQGPGGRTITAHVDGGLTDVFTHLAIDYSDNGSAGGSAYLTDPEGPRLGYEWTTEAPSDAPPGVNPKLLMEVHTSTLGFGGTGLEPSVAGADAVVETVFRYDDGTEEAVRIGRGHPGASVPEYDGLESASIRATLPEGEIYEITSQYDPTQTYEAACGVPVPPVGDDTRDDIDPSSDPERDEYVTGPYLEGPESVTFQCLAAVPEDLVAEPTVLERQSGTYYDVEEAGLEFDFGDGGYILGAPEEMFPGVDGPGPQYSGWGGGWSDQTGDPHGVVTYEALIWVDEDGAIIGRQQHDADDREGLGGEDLYSIGGGDAGDHLWYIGDTSELALPCEGVDPAEVEKAELGLIWGYGPSVDDMRWSVFFPERG
ncbi:hypothetical protein [Demequina aestuarii]|uniref:hypothetical protein n=1 Tax=Demequina aestuarii TaxID=327095 RepID=UPI00128B3619|nr:hypothetical protein [Demequina aestuarii]